MERKGARKLFLTTVMSCMFIFCIEIKPQLPTIEIKSQLPAVAHSLFSLSLALDDFYDEMREESFLKIKQHFFNITYFVCLGEQQKMVLQRIAALDSSQEEIFYQEVLSILVMIGKRIEAKMQQKPEQAVDNSSVSVLENAMKLRIMMLDMCISFTKYFELEKFSPEIVVLCRQIGDRLQFVRDYLGE